MVQLVAFLSTRNKRAVKINNLHSYEKCSLCQVGVLISTGSITLTSYTIANRLSLVVEWGLYDTTIVPLLNSIALDDDEVDILLDAHREMRLEIEDMSYYEEFIALGERIGSVSTGLSKETITTQLETRFYTRNPDNIKFEEFRYNIIRELFQINTIRV